MLLHGTLSQKKRAKELEYLIKISFKESVPCMQKIHSGLIMIIWSMPLICTICLCLKHCPLARFRMTKVYMLLNLSYNLEVYIHLTDALCTMSRR